MAPATDSIPQKRSTTVTGFKNFVFVVTFERKDRQMIEEVGDRPCRAKLRPRLREAVSNIGNRSIIVVGRARALLE